jgi:hypothetical protein
MTSLKKLVFLGSITFVISHAAVLADAWAEGGLNGLFNCKIEESKRWGFDSSSDWEEENHISISQFNIAYGITKDSHLYLKGLNYEETGIDSTFIDLKPNSVSTTRLQFYNYGSRVRANQFITDGNGKLMWVDKFHFDRDFISLEGLDKSLTLTRTSHDNWMGVRFSTWAGRKKSKGAIYLTRFTCKNEIDVIEGMVKQLYTIK